MVLSTWLGLLTPGPVRQWISVVLSHLVCATLLQQLQETNIYGIIPSPTKGVGNSQKESVTRSCLTVCNPMGYTVHGILPARILEWVAVAFSKGSFRPRNQTEVSCIAGGFFASWATRKEPTPVFLPRESPWTEEPDGLQSIPRGCWEILTTTLMHHHKAIYRELRSYSYLQDLQTF